MMQTFLPYADYADSARVLDRQRLGKQRVECLQILNALFDGKGWVNHPATKMWRGHEGSLIAYGRAICREWIARGYADTCDGKISLFWPRCNGGTTFFYPQWMGYELFHSSHRAALLAKDPEWYGQFGWTETPEINYIWPEAA